MNWKIVLVTGITAVIFIYAAKAIFSRVEVPVISGVVKSV